MASERDSAPFLFAHSSISPVRLAGRRAADTGSCPVAGLPRLFTFTGIDFIIYVYAKSKPSGRAESSAPALTRTKGHVPWLKLIPILAYPLPSIRRGAASYTKPLAWPLVALPSHDGRDGICGRHGTL